MVKNRIIISEIFNPAYNLGLEEYLIETGDNILYLWQNDNTIVIGRNQNPYKECNIKKIKEDKVNLVRRRSGGGAVYHDMGNLNFTIISKKHKNNIEENFDLVNKALSYENIKSVFNGRNDLHVDNKKISGNAFFEDEDIFCHHGTMLIDVDMNRLGKYLTASKLKLESKGIDSVKSRVVNLIDIEPNINVEKIIQGFIKAYKEKINNSDIDIEYFDKEKIENNPDIMEKVNRYSSWDWVFGESPKSNMYFEEKFDWGIIDLELDVESGFIKIAKIYTDSIINDNFDELSENLKNIKLKKENLIEKIEETIKDEKIKKDLIKKVNNF